MGWLPCYFPDVARQWPMPPLLYRYADTAKLQFTLVRALITALYGTRQMVRVTVAQLPWTMSRPTSGLPVDSLTTLMLRGLQRDSLKAILENCCTGSPYFFSSGSYCGQLPTVPAFAVLGMRLTVVSVSTNIIFRMVPPCWLACVPVSLRETYSSSQSYKSDVCRSWT